MELDLDEMNLELGLEMSASSYLRVPPLCKEWDPTHRYQVLLLKSCFLLRFLRHLMKLEMITDISPLSK